MQRVAPSVLCYIFQNRRKRDKGHGPGLCCNEQRGRRSQAHILSVCVPPAHVYDIPPLPPPRPSYSTVHLGLDTSHCLVYASGGSSPGPHSALQIARPWTCTSQHPGLAHLRSVSQRPRWLQNLVVYREASHFHSPSRHSSPRMQYAFPARPMTQLPAVGHVSATSHPRIPQTMTNVWVPSHRF
jgi:hypothetical protein